MNLHPLDLQWPNDGVLSLKTNAGARLSELVVDVVRQGVPEIVIY